MEKRRGGIAESGYGTPVKPVFYTHENDIYKYEVGPGPLRDFESHGKFALRPTASPDGTILALMTADGPRRPSSGPGMVFGSWGGGFYGQHYIELFHLPDMEPIGKPVRIPFTTVEVIDTPCWSPDGRFVVYSDYKGTRMCVIHVDQEGQKP